ncbi:protein kinase, ATP binding site-containing protein [Tanacetum coccineum]|uniref:Protein kinase, ATP binding site-containing protein n=1 Tax=Tanacetum coccineum TaxID=301880 RepID=A0ABQ5A807_9ASTR
MMSSSSSYRGGGQQRWVGDYVVGKQLGSGSFSVVWHARHKIHGTEVAIKEILTGKLNKKLEESLMYEIDILRNIHHPNIIRLHDMIKSLVNSYDQGRKLLVEWRGHSEWNLENRPPILLVPSAFDSRSDLKLKYYCKKIRLFKDTKRTPEMVCAAIVETLKLKLRILELRVSKVAKKWKILKVKDMNL